MTILRMTDLDLAGKRVLIRQDLNVPIDEDGDITSDQRIVASIPTLRHALGNGAAVMVMSHLGRPKEGAWSEADSLAPVAKRLSELLGREVPLVKDYLDGVEVAPGDIAMLEMVSRPIAFNPNAGLYRHAKLRGWEVVVERKDVIYENI